MKKDDLESIVNILYEEVKSKLFIEVEASGRHIHLSNEAIDALFSKDHKLTKIKDLSQPGQYACKERVTLIGPKGSIPNVIVLGPARENTQVEISKTDALILGIKVPVKESGDILNTPGILIASNNSAIKINNGLIVSKRHIHLSIDDAKKFNVRDKECVDVTVLGDRKLTFHDVVCRVSKDFKTFMHIDYDEANACGLKPKTLARIIK